MSSTGVVLIRGMFFHFIMLCLTDITTTIHSRFFPSFYVMFDFYITTTIHSRFFFRCSVLPCTTEALQWTRSMRGRGHGLPVRRRLRGWVCRVLLTTTVVVGDIETDFFFFFAFLLLFFTWYLFSFLSNHGCRRRLRGEGGERRGRPFGQIQRTVGWFERRQLDAREDEKVKRRHWQGHEENGNEWNENGWAIWRLSKLTDHWLDLLMMKASRTFRVVTTRCDNIKNMYDNTKIFKNTTSL